MFSSNYFFVSNTFFTKLRLFSTRSEVFFFLNFNYLFTQNPTLNYTLINLLSTKRLTRNLINNFVEKFQFIIEIHVNKLSKLVNSEVLKNKIRQKKHTYNFNAKT